ncbi:MAG: hypothetical protein ABI999_04080 [Acidobacteriota bacterium]
MDDENKAMTVNERLYGSGLMDAFDKAVEEKNVQVVRTILEKIGLTELSIIPILKQQGLKTHED